MRRPRKTKSAPVKRTWKRRARETAAKRGKELDAAGRRIGKRADPDSYAHVARGGASPDPITIELSGSEQRLLHKIVARVNGAAEDEEGQPAPRQVTPIDQALALEPGESFATLADKLAVTRQVIGARKRGILPKGAEYEMHKGVIVIGPGLAPVPVVLVERKA